MLSQTFLTGGKLWYGTMNVPNRSSFLNHFFKKNKNITTHYYVVMGDDAYNKKAAQLRHHSY